MIKSALFLAVLSAAVMGCATAAPYHSRVGNFDDSVGFSLPADTWDHEDMTLNVSERKDAPKHFAAVRVFTHRATGSQVMAMSYPNRLSEPELFALAERDMLRNRGLAVSDLQVSKSRLAVKYLLTKNGGPTVTVVVLRTPGKDRGIVRLVGTAVGGCDLADMFDPSK